MKIWTAWSLVPPSHLSQGGLCRVTRQFQLLGVTSFSCFCLWTPLVKLENKIIFWGRSRSTVGLVGSQPGFDSQLPRGFLLTLPGVTSRSGPKANAVNYELLGRLGGFRCPGAAFRCATRCPCGPGWWAPLSDSGWTWVNAWSLTRRPVSCRKGR